MIYIHIFFFQLLKETFRTPCQGLSFLSPYSHHHHQQQQQKRNTTLFRGLRLVNRLVPYVNYICISITICVHPGDQRQQNQKIAEKKRPDTCPKPNEYNNQQQQKPTTTEKTKNAHNKTTCGHWSAQQAWWFDKNSSWAVWLVEHTTQRQSGRVRTPVGWFPERTIVRAP